VSNLTKLFSYSVFSELDYAPFNDDSFAYGDAPDYSLGLLTLTTTDAGPFTMGLAKVLNVHFKLVPTNVVTYQLYLYARSGGGAGSHQLESHKFYDSTEHDVSCTGNVEYLRELVRVVNLERGYCWFVLVWSADPGATTGYIKVTGEREG